MTDSQNQESLEEILLQFSNESPDNILYTIDCLNLKFNADLLNEKMYIFDELEIVGPLSIFVGPAQLSPLSVVL